MLVFSVRFLSIVDAACRVGRVKSVRLEPVLARAAVGF